MTVVAVLTAGASEGFGLGVDVGVGGTSQVLLSGLITLPIWHVHVVAGSASVDTSAQSA
jgi:hypothetical protein